MSGTSTCHPLKSCPLNRFMDCEFAKCVQAIKPIDSRIKIKGFFIFEIFLEIRVA
jgi:hypothetical protein